MKLGAQPELPLIPAGEHILTLRAVKEVEFDDTYGKGENGKVKRLHWRFTSNEEDDEGCPYELNLYTNMAYGNSKASLTRLLDNMIPGVKLVGMTVCDKNGDEVETEELIGKKFKSQIKHHVNEAGKKRGDYVFITPIKAKPKAAETVAETKAAPAAEESEEDPFAEE